MTNTCNVQSWTLREDMTLYVLIAKREGGSDKPQWHWVAFPPNGNVNVIIGDANAQLEGYGYGRVSDAEWDVVRSKLTEIHTQDVKDAFQARVDAGA